MVSDAHERSAACSASRPRTARASPSSPFFGLFALQHRGQEAAGIAVSDGHRARVHKQAGPRVATSSPTRR